MNPAQSRQLNAYRSKLRQLADELADQAGFVTDPATLWRWDQARRDRGLAGLLSDLDTRLWSVGEFDE